MATVRRDIVVARRGSSSVTRAHQPWTPAEIAVARSDRPLAEIAHLLPHRSLKAIGQKRLRLPRRVLDMSALGRLSGAARRLVSIETKNRFIMAVSRGALLTQTGIVARSTYLAWSRQDPNFFAWLRGFHESRRAAVASRRQAEADARAARTAERETKQAKAERRRMVEKAGGLDAALRDCDIYEVASRAVGDVRPAYVRDEAISLMVLDLLEGAVEPDAAKSVARKYISKARGQVSFISADAPRGASGKSIIDQFADTADWQPPLAA